MRSSIALAVVLSLCAGVRAAQSAAFAPPHVYEQVVGEETIHVVASGETLGQIARRFGMPVRLVAAVNHLDNPNKLHLGERLLLSDRRIVPTALQDGIVINEGDVTLYWLSDGKLVAHFPVGVGRVAWKTPEGHYQIVGRRRDPVWHVPPSIQREMHEHGEPPKKKVLPGPDNPLGKYWLQLSVPGYGIHGTNAPWSVGKYTTHGCIRLRPEDIERLYKEVPDGTAVDIIDEPIMVARLQTDRVLIEAHPGVPDRAGQTAATFLERLRISEIADLIDFNAAERVVRDAWGIAVDVSKK